MGARSPALNGVTAQTIVIMRHRERFKSAWRSILWWRIDGGRFRLVCFASLARMQGKAKGEALKAFAAICSQG